MTTVRSVHVLSRQATNGVRPHSSEIRDIIKHNVATQRWQAAVVQFTEAIRLQVPVDAYLGCLILQQASRYPVDPAVVKAIGVLSDSMMFHTRDDGLSHTAHRQHGHNCNWNGLAVEAVSTMLSGLAHFNLHHRAMASAEHFARRGWRPSPRSMSSVRRLSTRPHALENFARVTLQLFRTVAWELAKTGTSDVRNDVEFVLESARRLMRLCRMEDNEHTFAGMLEIAMRPALLQRMNAYATTNHIGLSLVFAMVQQTPHAILEQPQSIQKVVHLCIQCGRVDKGLQFMAAMRAKNISIPVQCYNELLRSCGAENFQQAVLYIRLMREMEVKPDERTVIALLRLYWLSSDLSTSPAEYLKEVAAAMQVKLSSTLVGYMAFAAIKSGHSEELNKVLGLLQLVQRPAEAGAPKWLRKLADVVGADVLRP